MSIPLRNSMTETVCRFMQARRFPAKSFAGLPRKRTSVLMWCQAEKSTQPYRQAFLWRRCIFTATTRQLMKLGLQLNQMLASLLLITFMSLSFLIKLPLKWGRRSTYPSALSRELTHIHITLSEQVR